jgi:NADH dehydrogenase
VRVAARHRDRISFSAASDRLQRVAVDITDGASVRAAVVDAVAVANAVSLYVERGDATFEAVHVDGARRVAEAAAREGARLLHLSGIGSDADAASPYVRARGRGENAVRAACNGAIVFRPCVMTGAGDAFLTTLTGLVRRLPVFPLFGDGSTRLQPVFVGDVAEAAATALAEPDPRPGIYEIGGPEVLTYRTLVELVMRHCGRRRALLPVPVPVCDAVAAASRVLPAPPQSPRRQLRTLQRP